MMADLGLGAGITRHMRAPEARARCPELQLVHVQVIGADGRDLRDDQIQQQEPDSQQQQQRNGGGAAAAAPAGRATRLTHKACLERYRVASGHIMGLLRKLSPGVSSCLITCTFEFFKGQASCQS